MVKYAVVLLSAVLVSAPAAAEPAFQGELDVDPYTQSNANAGTAPVKASKVFEAFHGKEGIHRIVDDLLDRLEEDTQTADIFKGTDRVRARRTIKEQVCYILAGPCAYTGRSMAAAHKDMGLQRADFMIMVDYLIDAMDREDVPFSAQKVLLSKLAPMHRDVIER